LDNLVRNRAVIRDARIARTPLPRKFEVLGIRQDDERRLPIGFENGGVKGHGLLLSVNIAVALLHFLNFDNAYFGLGVEQNTVVATRKRYRIRDSLVP